MVNRVTVFSRGIWRPQAAHALLTPFLIVVECCPHVWVERTASSGAVSFRPTVPATQWRGPLGFLCLRPRPALVNAAGVALTPRNLRRAPRHTPAPVAIRQLRRGSACGRMQQPPSVCAGRAAPQGAAPFLRVAAQRAMGTGGGPAHASQRPGPPVVTGTAAHPPAASPGLPRTPHGPRRRVRRPLAHAERGRAGRSPGAAGASRSGLASSGLYALAWRAVCMLATHPAGAPLAYPTAAPSAERARARGLVLSSACSSCPDRRFGAQSCTTSRILAALPRFFLACCHAGLMAWKAPLPFGRDARVFPLSIISRHARVC